MQGIVTWIVSINILFKIEFPYQQKWHDQTTQNYFSGKYHIFQLVCDSFWWDSMLFLVILLVQSNNQSYKTYCLCIQDTDLDMFAQQLNSYPTYLPQGKNNQDFHRLQSHALEFQYSLCQLFLKKTGEQLHQKESHTMQDSSDLLQSIYRQRSENKGCSSTDSGTQSAQSSVQIETTFPTLQHSRRGEGGAWRKLEGKIGNWMSQVEEKCSVLCFINIKGILKDYNKLIEKWWQIEARQGILHRKNCHFQRQHQENLMYFSADDSLKRKLDVQNSKIQDLNQQMQGLREKNQTIVNYANDRLRELIGNQRIFEINEKVYRDVKTYLDDKQKSLARRAVTIELLEQDLIQKLFSSMPQSSCDSCCTMLKKLKESLMKFKRYLQVEGVELQNLFNRYKKTLFSQRSHHKLP